MIKLMFKIIIILFSLLLLQSCDFKEKNTSQTNMPEKYDYIDSVLLYHDRLNVVIPVEGELRAWQEINIMAPDTCSIISLLGEEGAGVKKGDLLISLWNLSKKREFTPFDIKAPISGIITKLYHNVNDNISAGAPIITIKNFDNLLLKIKLIPERLKLITKGQKALLNYSGQSIEGFVSRVDKNSAQVFILIANRNRKYNEGMHVAGEISCGKIEGDYILRRHFANDIMSIKVEDDIMLDLIKIGYSDSLVLVYPPLPGQLFIQIFQKKP
jgi:hypothetical protein